MRFLSLCFTGLFLFSNQSGFAQVPNAGTKLTREILHEQMKVLSTTVKPEFVWQYTVLSEARLLLEASGKLNSTQSEIITEYDTAAGIFIVSTVLGMYEDEEIERFNQATSAVFNLVEATIGFENPTQLATEDFFLVFQIPEDNPQSQQPRAPLAVKS